ncbi:hypothetical protein CPB84DRAFT_1109160 [Gymnopilus junonius]|uniref:Uncharacterized protein n=1 Tax=Gymnopilus junonius TaxID=109634 RepID=A0A9P5TLZ4_GYMJU|nr:hypothetical protein CPB84DRAFT_1109160 [Gymnopilus junonius]
MILIRDASEASQFWSMGIHVIIGSYSDLSVLQKLAGDSDFVFTCVSITILASIQALC